MESGSEVDLDWSDDSIVVENPSSQSFLAPKCQVSGNAFLPLALQPLVNIDPVLRDVSPRALYSADGIKYLLGTITRHEAAAIWTLLHSSEWQKTYQRLQSSLVKHDADDLPAFLPYLEILSGALQRLPKFRGNLWYYCEKEVHNFYQPGIVFKWSGFLRCKIQNEMVLDENCPQAVKTIFCIQTNSSRIVVPFSHNEFVPAVICPSTFFQVILLSKLRGNIFLVVVKEIHSPDTLEPKSSPVTEHDTPKSSQQYWDKLLQCMDPVTSSLIFLSVQNIAFATGNVPLYCSFLHRLSEMSSFQCSNSLKNLVFTANLKEMKRLQCYIVVQLCGCSLLDTLHSDVEFIIPEPVGTEEQTVILDALRNHKENKDMIHAGLKLLRTLSAFATEFDRPQEIVDIVLSGMKCLSGDIAIQVTGCSLLDSLSQNLEYVPLIMERHGREVILNAIRVHRKEKVLTEACWRILLRLVRYNNNNDYIGDGNVSANVDSFDDVLKDVLKAYSKTPSIQAEGLLTLKETLVAPRTHLSEDISYIELVISAIRNHGSNETIVDFSFGILVELTKSVKLTKYLIHQEALTCVLGAMKQHFNVANVQKLGCKILRNIAKNGYRSYRQNSQMLYGSSSPVLGSQEIMFDFRLKIVESGGLDVIISAMKTHSTHIGTQREGCLTIRTLAVNAANVVESRGQEDVIAVLATFSKFSSDLVMQTAALRALSILTINPSNREFLISNRGVELILLALKAFPACGKVLEEGVVTLGNLSHVTKGALAILRGDGLQTVLSLMECETISQVIITSVCVVLGNLCLLSLHLLKADDLLPTDIMFQKGGYTIVANLMTKYPENLQLQKESCRVICTLPHDLPTGKSGSKDVIIESLFKSIQNFSEDVKLLSIRCRAVGRAITFFDLFDTMIPNEMVDFVLSMMHQYHEERDLMRECCVTLSIMTTNGVYILRTIFDKGGVICMLNCLKQYHSDKQITLLCLKIMNSIFPNQLRRTIWELLNLFQTNLRELTRQQILSVGGMETLLEILTNNFEDSSIVSLVAPLLLLSFSSQERVANANLVDKINKLLTDIRNYYTEEDSCILTFCDELSCLVNK